MAIPPEDREYFERLGEAEVLLSLSTDGFLSASDIRSPVDCRAC